MAKINSEVKSIMEKVYDRLKEKYSCHINEFECGMNIVIKSVTTELYIIIGNVYNRPYSYELEVRSGYHNYDVPVYNNDIYLYEIEKLVNNWKYCVDEYHNFIESLLTKLPNNFEYSYINDDSISVSIMNVSTKNSISIKPDFHLGGDGLTLMVNLSGPDYKDAEFTICTITSHIFNLLNFFLK